jgi:hypothetical protein
VRLADTPNDDPGPDVAGRAATRDAPTLIVSPDPRIGWTEAEYRQLVAFATQEWAGVVGPAGWRGG